MANLLGSKIKELRKAKGLTLEQLASMIGSGKSYIWGRIQLASATGGLIPKNT